LQRWTATARDDAVVDHLDSRRDDRHHWNFFHCLPRALPRS
jgi:hypothetical protein